MAITSYGYGGSGTTGQINAQQWAAMAPYLSSGAPAVVAPHDDAVGLGLTVTSAGARTVSIGAGKATGWGIFDIVDAAVTLQFDAGSGTTPRWDAVVLHRDWGARTTTLEVVAGQTSTSPVQPSGAADNEGVVADHILYLVPITSAGILADQVVLQTAAFGSMGYYRNPPGANAHLVAGNFPYGSLVVQTTAAGQPNLFLRQGGAGPAGTFTNLLDPDWTDLSGVLYSSVAQTRPVQGRVNNGRLELLGSIRPATDPSFVVGGGVDGNFDVCTLPTTLRPVGNRYPSAIAKGGAGIRFIIASTGIVRFEVTGVAASVVDLDNISVAM